MSYVCQACLAAGGNLSLMTVAEVQTYRGFICKSGWRCSDYMYMCAFCRHLLRKLFRFVRQCQAAADVLREAAQLDTNLLPKPSLVFDLQRTPAKVVDVGLAPVEEVRVGECSGDEGAAGEGGGASGGSDGEDDLPLVMLQSAGRGGPDVMESRPVEPSSANGHEDSARKKKKHRKKKKEKERKKPLREGFTSRMVQETAEYVVIKLTKEQVLQEMAERAQSERYRLAPFKCERCVKGFNFEDVLAAHRARHAPAPPPALRCQLCGQYCAGAVSLRGHMKSHTTRYRCKVCGLVRLSRQHVLEHHALAHAAAAAPHYSCRRCHFTTNKRTVMQHHVRRHGAREPLACHRCGKLYKNVETLRIHITRHEAHRRVRCARCPLSFVSAAQLRRHERAVHERRDCYCVECDLAFNSMDTLKLHFQKAKRHRDASSYKHACGECPARFVSAATLATHAAAAHGAAPRARCPLCAAPRAFSSRDALRVHLRRAHPRKTSKTPADGAVDEGKGAGAGEGENAPADAKDFVTDCNILK